jgi:hypothetical protein
MQFFKFTLPVLLSLISLLSLTSCQLPKPTNENPVENFGRGSFYVKSQKGQFIALKTYANIDLPQSRTISFNMCIENRRTRQPLMNQAFEVVDDKQAVLTSVMSDNQGCINWTEIIKFPVYKTAKYIKLDREIRTRGRFTGQLMNSFVVDPWRSQVFGEVDTDFKSRHNQSITLEQLAQEKPTATLRVMPTRALFTIQEIQQKEATFKFDFMGDLALEIKDQFNMIFPMVINRAKYKFRLTFFNRRKNGEYYLIHQSSKWSDAKEMQEGRINLTETYKSNTYSCRNGRLDIGLEIELADEKTNDLAADKETSAVKGFEMLYQGPSCQATGFNFVVPSTEYIERLRNNPKATMEAFVDDVLKKNPTAVMQQATKDQGDVIYLSPLRPEFSQVTYRNALVQKTYRLHTCLTSVVDTDTLRREPLIITDHQGVKHERTTDDKGCFAWTETYDYDYYQPQCWRATQTQIQTHDKRMSFELPIGLMVGGENDQIRDLRYFEIPSHQNCNQLEQTSGQVSTHSKATFIVIPRFSFEKQDYQYHVDRNLNLTLFKKGNLQLHPYLARPSLTDPSGIEEAALPPGDYTLSVAIVDIDQKKIDHFDGSKIYSLLEQTVKVRAGSLVSETIELPFKDMKAMSNTNWIFISLKPITNGSIHKNNHLKEVVYRGPFIPRDKFENSSLEPISSEDILSRLRIARFQFDTKIKNFALANHGKNKFSSLNNLLLVNLDSPNSEQFRQALARVPLHNADQQKVNPIPASDLFAAIDNPNQLHKLRHQWCQFFIGHLWMQKINNKHILPPNTPHKFNLMIECQRLVRESIHQGFEIKPVTFVDDAKINAQIAPNRKLSGQLRDFGVTQNFSIQKQLSEQFSQSWGWDIGTGLRLPDIPGMRYLSGTSGVRYQINFQKSSSESLNNFESLATSLPLVSETLTAPLISSKAERCVVIKLDPKLFFKRKQPYQPYQPTFWIDLLNEDLTDLEKLKVISQGVLICEGTSNKGPVEYLEHYHTLNQKMFESSLIDIYSNHSRPFFASIRGNDNYFKLIGSIVDHLKLPHGFIDTFKKAGFRENDIKDLFLKDWVDLPGMSFSPVKRVKP